MAKSLIRYCVSAQKKDVDELGFYAWVEARTPEEAIIKVRGDSIMTDSYYDRIEPTENWIAEDIDIGKQMNLFQKIEE